MLAHATDWGARRARRGGGFTLIELVVVMVVMAILAVVAAPAFTNMNDTRQAMAAKQLLRDLAFAHQWAVATGTVTWMVFDTDAETWTVLAEDPGSPGRSGASVIDDPATGRTFVYTLGTDSLNGVELVSADFDSDVEIGFDWLGRPLNAAETELSADGTVTLSGSYAVTVNANTGYAVYVAP